MTMKRGGVVAILLASLSAIPSAVSIGPGPASETATIRPGDDLGDAIRWALDRQADQALRAGLPLPPPQGHGDPSLPEAAGAGAAEALLARRGTGPVQPAAVLAALGSLPGPERSALDALLRAFLRFEDAAQAAFDLEAGVAPAASDLAPVLDARADLMLAANRFHRTVPEALPGGIVLDACPAIALDLAGVPSRYTTDCALIVDVGGDDAYENNAGGTGRGWLPYPTVPGVLSFPQWVTSGFPAAAVLDFSGNDRYGDPQNSRTSVMGGGIAGTGFLLDAKGDDTYGAMGFVEVSVGGYEVCGRTWEGNVRCATGSAIASFQEIAPYDGGDAVGLDAGEGVTCILTRAGNVDCRAADARAETLDYLGGDAVEVDVGGFHRCVRTTSGDVRCAASGGPGEDPYGGHIPDHLGGDAVGLDMSYHHRCVLLRSGNVTCAGRNASGESAPYLGGDAVEVDVGHRVTCVRTREAHVFCHGAMAFRDTKGDAVEVATSGALVCIRTTSGDVRCSGWGASHHSYGWGDARSLDVGAWASRCVLTSFGTVDCTDAHHTPDLAHALGVNGGGSYGAGFLLDLQGNDAYVAGRAGTNGGTYVTGMGMLLDRGGDDHYRADFDGGNGGAAARSLACVPVPSPGQVPPPCVFPVPGPKLGLLHDAGGHDRYEDGVVTCWDCTSLPKGVVGAQVDEEG